MEDFNVDKYRERSTAEIAEEQKLLEKLRQKTMADGRASWEWDGQSHQFIVSDKWQRLTGYSKDEIFPVLSPEMPIEGLLDNLVEKWLGYVFPAQKEDTREKLDNFLILNNSDNYLELEYLFKSASGEYIPLLTVAQSVWKGGKLMALFAQTHRLTNNAHVEKYLKQGHAAVAIATQEDATKVQDEKLKVLKDKIEGLKSFLLLILPVVAGIIVALNELLPPIAKGIQTSISLFWNPPLVEQAQTSASDGYLLGDLSEETIEKLKNEMRTATPDLGVVQFGAYEKSPVPAKYKILIQSDQEGIGLPYYQPEKSTTADEPTTGRTERHIAEEAYNNRQTREYSTPVKILTKGGSQVGFVLITYDRDNMFETIEKTDKLASRIREIISSDLK